MRLRNQTLAVLAMALFVSGCGKDTGGGPSSGAIDSVTVQNHSTQRQPRLPLLSPKEVARRLSVHPLGASGASAAPSAVTPEQSVQFAQSLEAHLHDSNVIEVIQAAFKECGSISEEQKPLYLVAGAQLLEAGELDKSLYIPCLRESLKPSRSEREVIAALAVVAQHPEIGPGSYIFFGLFDLAGQTATLGALVRHWLAVAFNAAVRLHTDTPEGLRDAYLEGAMANPGLDLDTLTERIPMARIKHALDLGGSSFPAERAMLVRMKLLQNLEVSK